MNDDERFELECWIDVVKRTININCPIQKGRIAISGIIFHPWMDTLTPKLYFGKGFEYVEDCAIGFAGIEKSLRDYLAKLQLPEEWGLAYGALATYKLIPNEVKVYSKGDFPRMAL